MQKFGRAVISILVPARNEESHIETFLSDVTRACADLNIDYEVLVVESGSADETSQKVRTFSGRNASVRLVNVAEPGYGLALIRGIEMAQGEYIVIFNVDFWDKRFLYLPSVNNLDADIVNGSKMLPGSSDGRSVYRRAVSHVFNRIFLRWLLSYRGTDTHGIKSIRKQSVLPIMRKCVTASDIFDTELMVRAERAGLKILELPISIQEIRPSRFSGKRIVRIPWDIVQLWWTLTSARRPGASNNKSGQQQQKNG